MAQVALKKRLMALMVLSLALAAVLGVGAILTENLGIVASKILFSTLVISGVSMLSLAPSIQLERNRNHGLALLGIGSAIVSGLLLLFMIWAERGNDAVLKTTFSMCLAATGLSHASLLLLASLSNRFRPVLFAALALTGAFVGQLVFSIWGEVEPEWRILSINAILLLSSSLAVPILHRMSKLDHASSDADTVNCPCCSASCHCSSGEIDCKACGCSFSVKKLGRK